MTTRGKNRGYKTYGFSGQDPDVKEILVLLQRTNHSRTYLCNKSGVTSQTIRNWESKKTKRPQHATMQAIAKAAGYKFKLVRE